MSRTKVITIDGPASSGKSSVGYLFSKKIGYVFVDSGLIYRLGTFLALKNNVNLKNEEKCANIFENLNIEFIDQDNDCRILLDGTDMTDLLKTRQISAMTPIFGSMKKVREVVEEIQRKFADTHPTVVAGRNVGTDVFPDAVLKFYIDAPLEERARRRYNQQIKNNPNLRYEDILLETEKRDKNDINREYGPMRIPKGAVIIQNYNKTIEKTVNELMYHFQKLSNLFS